MQVEQVEGAGKHERGQEVRRQRAGEGGRGRGGAAEKGSGLGDRAGRAGKHDSGQEK